MCEFHLSVGHKTTAVECVSLSPAAFSSVFLEVRLCRLHERHRLSCLVSNDFLLFSCLSAAARPSLLPFSSEIALSFSASFIFEKEEQRVVVYWCECLCVFITAFVNSYTTLEFCPF